ncbi:GTP cyclohydrolase I FolE2 [Pseudomonas fluvialis]|uniref:GTP cyclohydrolase FolE2 n=1 Tax=Pseudomonas fluvialis TaxID=1793966 RepID=A0ABQ2ATM2_9PSED|nr:GTP cyclohydrolase FolE2 [Pseudomonas fluvialis]OXM40314.1 GTP cyclohydrolase I FolE2 [Pseudomonas fluvialis]GGH96123.1 GTP cyclohydrolase FolE2 [Pseudomonas fluvialis]
MTTLKLPDIAAQGATLQQTLSWVGMREIAIPLLLDDQRLAARAHAGVSLDQADARGIHMSRLYLALQVLEHEPLTPAVLQRLLQQFLSSHQGLSQRAYLELEIDWLLRRPALLSPLQGWKHYPLQVRAQRDEQGFHVELQVQIAYSSTCPCSAALARQLIQEQFAADFAEQPLQAEAVRQWLGSSQGILATPHSQRSQAQVAVQLQMPQDELPARRLLEACEAALGTAVQTAVKRADEQAFALANGQNLMFCEDAARRLHGCLLDQPGLSGFQVRVVHAESLHAHDAVACSRHNWQVRD